MNVRRTGHCPDSRCAVLVAMQQALRVLGRRRAMVLTLLTLVLGLTLVLAGCGGAPESRLSDQLHVSCLEKPATGVCRAAKPAFYYDYPSDSCRRFSWGGCGNKAPFQSMDQCVKTCGGRPGF